MFIRNKTFGVIMTGALLVIIGVVLENGYGKQAKAYGAFLANLPEGVGAAHDAAEAAGLGDPPFTSLASWLFLLGWLTVAYGMGMRGDKLRVSVNRKGLLALLGALSVVTAVMLKAYNEQGEFDDDTKAAVEVLIPVFFIGGWLLVAYLSSLKSHLRLGTRAIGKNKVWFALAGVSLVFGAMLPMGMLPLERDLKITDSIGMPMFTLGWVCVALANALHEYR